MRKSGDTGEGGVGGKRADLASLSLFRLALDAHWPIPDDLVQANETELRKILIDPEAGRRSKLAAMRVLDSMRRANLASIETAIRAAGRAEQAAEQERERVRTEKSIAEDVALVAALMTEGLSREQAEEFVAELHELGVAEKMKNWTITDELKNRVLGWPVRPRVSAARKDEIVNDLLCRYGLAAPTPDPAPAAGPAPAPDPAPTPDPAPVPVWPGVLPGNWVDLGGEFCILIPEE